ncbi:hypothetical protein [Haloferula rosea]|uniref:Uncharacterized protein n=1 Tax=Haloferula rosea TaxID=490093 RepID=A0A934RH28_9BACT|nr:hypothetical protein [Haloferula rosea]MBK1829029.1 hypothetical protein [Haloferula rosea]
MKALLILSLSLLCMQAEEAPKFNARFIVPGKLEYFPHMILDQVTEPERLRDLARELAGRQTADATAISITERPFKLSDTESKVISQAFTADEGPAKDAFKSMPLDGPHRAFGLMNVDGKFGAIILDYRGVVVITKVNWIGDGFLQPDRSWTRAVVSRELNTILNLASIRPAKKTPFQDWFNDDRYQKVADALNPEKDKQNRVPGSD